MYYTLLHYFLSQPLQQTVPQSFPLHFLLENVHHLKFEHVTLYNCE